jgi:acetyltransferase-like isoleucine patch superfamily enzyme
LDRLKALSDESKKTFEKIIDLHNDLDNAFIEQFQRSLPFNEELIDRWERAKRLGFGKDSSIYNSSLVFGKVRVGKNCWIGPHTIIDGSGGLTIGDNCTISAGVQIYSHDNVKQTLSSGKLPIERLPVSIGNNVYIGPNTIVSKGVKIGNFCVIGANSFLKSAISDNAIAMGQPAKVKGKVIFRDDKIDFEYWKQ